MSEQSFKDSLIDAIAVQAIQHGVFTLEDIAMGIVKKMGSLIETADVETDCETPVAIERHDKARRSKKKTYYRANGRMSLANSEGKVRRFPTKTAACEFLGRSNGYISQCLSDNRPIYDIYGEEWIVWDEDGRV